MYKKSLQFKINHTYTSSLNIYLLKTYNEANVINVYSQLNIHSLLAFNICLKPLYFHLKHMAKVKYEVIKNIMHYE